MEKRGFDNEKYLLLQSRHIRQRLDAFGGKLYLEFGGKLFDDNHAARVLPGFEPDSKLQMLLQLKEQVEMVIVISAGDIEKNKIRGDLGITYDRDALRLLEIFRELGLYVSSVVLTRFTGQSVALAFQARRAVSLRALFLLLATALSAEPRAKSVLSLFQSKRKFLYGSGFL